MKYIYVIYDNESRFYENINFIKDNSNSNDFKVIIFAKGQSSIKTTNCQTIVEASSNNPLDLMFTAAGHLTAYLNDFTDQDELIIVSRQKEPWDNFFNQIILLKRKDLKFTWKDSDTTTLISLLPNNFCLTCKVFFDNLSDKSSHQKETCNYCGNNKCNGNKCHELVIDPRCKSMGCTTTYRDCQTDQIEKHLKEHLICKDCNKWFLNNLESNNHEIEKICNACHKVKCNNPEAHLRGVYSECLSIGCSYELNLCNETEIKSHVQSHISFHCNDCDEKFYLTKNWFEHSKSKGHIILCPMIDCNYCLAKTCSSQKRKKKRFIYSSKVKKMKRHIQSKFTLICDICHDNYFFDQMHYDMHMKHAHSSPLPTVVPLESLTWGTVEENLIKLIHEQFTNQQAPAWTLLSCERNKLQQIRSELKQSLASAKLFSIGEQGSMLKDTAVPGYADFDFVLNIRSNTTNIKDIKEEIKTKLHKCHHLYGESEIETWIYQEISFDVIIAYPNNPKFQGINNNVKNIVEKPGDQRDKLHSMMRSIKYLKSRMKLPLRSFVIEYISLHLFFIYRDKLTFKDLLKFLIDSSDWERTIQKIPITAIPTSEEKTFLKEFAIRANQCLLTT